MFLLEGFVWAVLGLIMGSFTNVLILRHGTGKSVGGRSACLSCSSKLTWLDLWPIISWLSIRGHCRACGSRISVQYPLVEALAAVGFAAVGLAPIPIIVRLLGCGIVMLCLAIAVYDYYHTIIPDRWVYSLGALSLLYIFFAVPVFGMYSVLLALSGGIAAAAPLFLLWAISNGAWMGFGDVKLALALGWVLGPIAGVQAILIAFVVGAIVGIALLSVPKLHRVFHILKISSALTGLRGYTIKSEVPFGPFVIIAFLIVWFAALYNIALPLPTVFLL